MRIRSPAPFLINHRWVWLTLTASTTNTHAACSQHATAIGAAAWDASQASVKIGGDVVRGSPTVF
jgi:hypothetical protein